MTAPTPLLDFFKRGEVAHDVRLLAAEGALAPRAHEQLAILLFLLDDPNPVIRTRADETLARIPVDLLGACLARPDTPTELREAFAARGVTPSGEVPMDGDEPLIDTNAADVPEDGEAEEPEGVIERLGRMGFSERLKAAIRGGRQIRSILIRDPNRMIATAVLSNPKVTDSEVETIARMANVSEDVLRGIGLNRGWMKNYSVVVGLSRNPKTPVGVSLNLLSRLSDRDLSMLASDRNVPQTLRAAASRQKVSKTERRGR